MEWIENYGPQLLYWALTGVVGAFAVWVWRKIKAQKVEQDAIEDGVKAILHDRIYQAHRYTVLMNDWAEMGQGNRRIRKLWDYRQNQIRRTK